MNNSTSNGLVSEWTFTDIIKVKQDIAKGMKSKKQHEVSIIPYTWQFRWGKILANSAFDRHSPK